MPLYMLLFGGMMLMGDMVLGGVNLYNANRMLAWNAMDRFTTDDELLLNQVKNLFYYPGEEDDPWDFDDSNKPESDWAIYYKFSSGQQQSSVQEYVTQNRYLTLFKGSMPLKLNKIPLLYQGLLAINDVMNRPDDVKAAENGEPKDLLYKTVFDLGKDEWFSHYLVKRISNTERNMSAADLADGTWVDIVVDEWIRKTTTQTGTPSGSAGNSGDNGGYIRGLAIFAGAVEQ